MVDHFLNSSHAPPTPEMSLQTEFPFLAGHPWPQQDLNHPPREITEPGTPATPPPGQVHLGRGAMESRTLSGGIPSSAQICGLICRRTGRTPTVCSPGDSRGYGKTRA